MPSVGGEESRQRVLVVDDEIYIADALSTSLRHVGFEARAVFDGRSALESVREWAPDLVLLDVMLPDMTGYDVCRELVMAGDDVAVIFLSARDEVSDRVRGFSVGADDYVTKPFSLEEVVARVRATTSVTRCGAARSPSSCLRRSTACSASCCRTRNG